MNVVLCGMMGSGKSTVGKALAKALAWEWTDTDECIIRRNGSITDIFKQKGEGYFRELEQALVQALAQKDNLVISTGGGLMLSATNRSLLKERGKIVYLRATKQTLVSRLQGEKDRPLLQTEEGLDKKIEELLEERAGIYESVADFIIDVDEKTPTQIAQEILAKIKG